MIAGFWHFNHLAIPRGVVNYGIEFEEYAIKEKPVTLESSFVNDLGADSLDIVELVMELEDEFDVSIPDEDAEKMQTVGDAVKYINEHTQKK